MISMDIHLCSYDNFIKKVLKYSCPSVNEQVIVTIQYKE